jgi:hypothetical protein
LLLAQMILEAIHVLKDKNGSNKSAISRHIEGKYRELPAAHESLLTEHLARLKESGDLIFVKNTYFRAEALVEVSKTRRGRPPKQRDPNAPPPAPKPVSGRPRGRPPKAKAPLDAAVAQATAGMPRGRGRPPKKAKTAAAAALAAPATGDGTAPVKRGRGRPPKFRPAVPSETEAV